MVISIFAIGAIALFGWWLAMLIDALRTPQDVWAAARLNQIVYVLVMVVVPLIGALIYVMVARPQLRAIPSRYR